MILGSTALSTRLGTGLCLQQEPLADEVMASMAREMNLSETAVVLREGDVCRLR